MTRYELVERIGFGGMAEVFRGLALATGGFEKPVAIKRILPHLSEDRRFVELLMAEAKFLSHLRHRNIVQIYDVGLSDDGRYFLVMEYVDGVNTGKLYDTLEARGKRLPMDIAVHIGAEVCEALEHAHRARGPDGELLGLVHRDVSPSNVLLSRSGEVKLTDFGIAKRMEDHTGHGGLRGKFAYISPEQAKSEPVDGRSDVFSLGVVLYELVVGHRLFSHLQDFEALRAILDGTFSPPREVDPSMPAELEAILLKALAHEPDRRYASAGELGGALRDFRYGALSTSGDPAAELASILARHEWGEEGAAVEEHTVVRLRPATEAGGGDGAARENEEDFREARAIIDAYEEETRAVQLDPEALFGAEPTASTEVPSALEAGDAPYDRETTVMDLNAAEAAPFGDRLASEFEQTSEYASAAAKAAFGAGGSGSSEEGSARAPAGGGAHPRAEAGPGAVEGAEGDARTRGGGRAEGDRSPRGSGESARGAGGDGARAAARSRDMVVAWIWLALAAVAVGVSAFWIASAFFDVNPPPDGGGGAVEDGAYEPVEGDG